MSDERCAGSPRSARAADRPLVVGAGVGRAMEDTSLDRAAQGRAPYAAAGRSGRSRSARAGSRRWSTTPTAVRSAPSPAGGVVRSRLDAVPGPGRRPRRAHRGAARRRDAPRPGDRGRRRGVHLLPGIGDLDPECDCPAWELPCQHAAALSFQASWLLDADPFVLLLIRGKGEREIREELESRTAPRAELRGRGPDAGGCCRTWRGSVPSGAPSIPAAPGVPAEAFALLADPRVGAGPRGAGG